MSDKTKLKKLAEGEIEKNKLFPNRHIEIHKACCKHCPSNNNRRAGIKDPETEDLKGLPKELIAKEYLFVCAWRNEKLCKGICDKFGIDEQFTKACAGKN